MLTRIYGNDYSEGVKNALKWVEWEIFKIMAARAANGKGFHKVACPRAKIKTFWRYVWKGNLTTETLLKKRIGWHPGVT